MKKQYTQEDLSRLVEEAKQAALHAACVHIQNAFGQTDGGLASMHFTGQDPFASFTKRLLAYATSELQHASCELVPTSTAGRGDGKVSAEDIYPLSELGRLLKERIANNQLGGKA